RINLATMMVGHNNANHFCQNPGNHITRDSSFNVVPNTTSCRNIFKWNPTSGTINPGSLRPTIFRDRRERLPVYSLDIDMAELRSWANADWTGRRIKVLYVEFYNNPGYYTAVRIINGTKLPGTEPTPSPAADYGLTI